ncbi:MAG: DUF5689 domain-containing protein [Bacteroidales bacterium]|nr:DUF5689 domain-containing protein [Bacteroidales bacterium]
MKITNKIRLFICILGLGALVTSCNWEPDVAPIPTFDGTANTTIAELIAMHELGSVDSYDSIPAGTIITGIVTTSDEHGNCYKYINIEDGTAGIQIKINNSALFNRYKVGQRVFVKCDGLVIGDYRKLPQIGLWENDAMQAIPSNKASNYIFCDGAPVDLSNPEVFTPIVLTSIPNADNMPVTYYNRLVRLDNATFVEGGTATYCAPNAATSHDIKMADGSTITMRTSNYADFINEVLPEGTGTIYGIMTRYNNYVQLVIRDLNDVQGFSAPTHLETIFSVSDYTNAFNNGWLKVTNGAEWSVLSNSSFSGFGINAGSSTNSWLVSPEINLLGASNATLSFKHRTPAGGNNNVMKCYYTTNFTGDVNTTTWTAIPVTNFNTNFVNFDYVLPENAQSNKFRIAFQYEGSGSSWYIGNIAISATVTQ